MQRMLRACCAVVVLAAMPGSVRAQIVHLPAGQQLGEGTRQPNDAPLVLPDSSGRRVPSIGKPWSVRVAESVMKRNPQTHRRWDYTGGVILSAIERVATTRKDPRMLAYVDSNTARWITPDGSIEGYELDEYNLDHVAQGRLLFGLYARTGEVRYRKAADLLRSQLRTQPRTAEGGFWHKKIYPQQMWLDGLYMAAPFYAQYARDYREPAAFDDIARQFLLIARHTRNPATGLLHHAWDAARAQKWADTTTGLSASIWGRSMGWYVLGIVEALDYIPASHPDRAAIIAALRDALDAIARVQDPVTGLWWNVMDQPNRTGNYLEASASSMFVYSLGKAARLGYVDAAQRRAAERGFNGIIRNLVRVNADSTVSLINIIQSAGVGGNLRKDGSYRDGSFMYYATEPVVTDDYKGVGPFILAALELGR